MQPSGSPSASESADVTESELLALADFAAEERKAQFLQGHGPSQGIRQLRLDFWTEAVDINEKRKGNEDYHLCRDNDSSDLQSILFNCIGLLLSRKVCNQAC